MEQVAVRNHNTFGQSRGTRCVLEKCYHNTRNLGLLPFLRQVSWNSIGSYPFQSFEFWNMSETALQVRKCVQCGKPYTRLCISYNSLDTRHRSYRIGWIGRNSDCASIQTTKEPGNIFQAWRMKQKHWFASSPFILEQRANSTRPLI